MPSDSFEPAGIQDETTLSRERQDMIATQIMARGVLEPRTLEALRAVPRHRFVPERLIREAYADHPLPIGHGQTISQPFIVAAMTAVLDLQGEETVLEVGVGCGYQTAVLSRVASRVFGLEIVEALALLARARLDALGFKNVEIRSGDGSMGWPERAPFDAILVAAAAPRVPESLKAQLKDGGRLILPVGDYAQVLKLLTRRGSTFEERDLLAVQFVPMTGEIRRV